MEALEQSLKDGYVVKNGHHMIDLSSGERTFMDGLYEHLLNQKVISVHQLNKLIKSFQEDQYDSDVFLNEINDEKNNMIHIVDNSRCYHTMKQYCTDLQI
eukprot:192836_1